MGAIKVPTKELGKEVIRSDFVENEFDKEIRAYGYRVYWQAAEDCPCRANATTNTPDPSCKACGGDGILYTFPDPGVPPLKEYLESSPPFCDTANARATQALITSMTNDTELFEKMGTWLLGSARLTTFTFNDVAFRDRFTLVDGVMPFKQVVTLGANKIVDVGRAADKIRYPAVKILRAFSVNTKTGAMTDFTTTAKITASGAVDLSASAAVAGSLVSIRYTMHPVWVVMEHPFALRDSLSKKKGTALGKRLRLPTHAMVKLDFLLDAPSP